VRKEINATFLLENLKRLIGRAWQGWEYVTADIQEIGCEGIRWTHLSQDRD